MKLSIIIFRSIFILILAVVFPVHSNAQTTVTNKTKSVHSHQAIIAGSNSLIKSSAPTSTLWNTFTSRLTQGIDHFKKGTDHLLFLLTLLLAAPLVAINKRWAGAGNTQYGLIRVLKIVLAFTAGHLITLIICALGWVNFPAQLIAVLIAACILLSAVHTLKPILQGKEIYLAAGFGLVHGLAFVQTLAGLHLSTSQLMVSVSGFNLGLELMQLFVIAITLPWLIMLSQTFFYTTIRITCAIFAGIAALALIAERSTQDTNFIAAFVSRAAEHTKWVILLFAIIAIFSFLSKNRSSFSHGKEWQ